MRAADILKVGIALVAIQFACVSTQASWYWPFGSGDREKEPPRLSELMEPASLLIDEAADLAAEGKGAEAIAKYREAQKKLDEIERDTEREFPGRTKKPEFATLRNKRAYVSAAIDSMLLGQVTANARSVAVSETDDLEIRLVGECAEKCRKAALGGKFSDAAASAEKIRRTSTRPYAELISRCAEAISFCAKGETEEARRSVERAESSLKACGSLSDSVAKVVTNLAGTVEWLAVDAPEEISRAGAAAVADCRRLQVAWTKDEVTKLSVIENDAVTSNAYFVGREKILRTADLAAPYATAAGRELVARAKRLKASVGQDTNDVFRVDSGAVAKYDLALKSFAERAREYESVGRQMESFRRAARKVLPWTWDRARKAKPKARVVAEEKKTQAKAEAGGKKSKPTLRQQAMLDIRRGDYAAAKLSIDEMLAKNPNSAAALNLKAVMEICQGRLKTAEATLDLCIMNNPKSHFAYYNMCELYLRKGDPAGAKRYYETGRAFGGPKNEKLERVLK